MGKNRSSMVRKIEVVLLAVIFLTLLGGWSVSSYGTKLISDTIQENIHTVSQRNLQRLENDVANLSYLGTKLVSDASLASDIQPSSAFSIYQKLNEMLKIQEDMNLMRLSSEYIKDIRLHMPEAGRSISFYGGITAFETQEFEAFVKLFEDTNRWSSHFFAVGNGLYIVVVNKAFSLNMESAPNIMCVIELSNQEILKTLELFSDNTLEEGYVLQEKSGSYRLFSGGDIQTAKLVLEEAAGQAGDSYSSQISGNSYQVIKNYNDDLKLELICYVPHKTLFTTLDRFHRLLYFLIILLLVLGVFLFFFFSKTLFQPIKELVEGFRQVEQMNFHYLLKRKEKDEFGFAFSAFNKMVQTMDVLVKQKYQYTIAMQKATLKQLQAQINPHFLYNSFYILKHRIKSYDYEGAIEFAEYLGDYFRFITKEYSDFIPLEIEVDHAVTYMKIQSTRFQGRITFFCEELPEEYQQVKVPKLILQPVLENAFVHGFEKGVDSGFIRMGFSRKSDAVLEILIENSAENLVPEAYEKLLEDLKSGRGEEGNVSGLSNISLRLKILYGEDYNLRVSYEENIFAVRILIRKNGAENFIGFDQEGEIHV